MSALESDWLHHSNLAEDCLLDAMDIIVSNANQVQRLFGQTPLVFDLQQAHTLLVEARKQINFSRNLALDGMLQDAQRPIAQAITAALEFAEKNKKSA